MRINRIKFITELEKRDMTQKRLAELSGVSRATINYIKGGKRCTDEVGQKIAKALNVTVEEILED
ncbi:MAG: helix-turn-helix domain-containing protein [Lachnospiraceae bacterium]|nr:helix-turn-helix domain-containing protein [Lachnospiraceae bacterium]